MANCSPRRVTRLPNVSQRLDLTGAVSGFFPRNNPSGRPVTRKPPAAMDLDAGVELGDAVDLTNDGGGGVGAVEWKLPEEQGVAHAGGVVSTVGKRKPVLRNGL